MFALERLTDKRNEGNDKMGNEIYENVKTSLISNGVHEDLTVMFLKKGLKDLELTEDTIDEKSMGIVLQRHVLKAIGMFLDEEKAHKAIHRATMDM